jgi:60 kDa SS-A/Ro ribonucleoprotein
MRSNVRPPSSAFAGTTFEGAPARKLTPEQLLRRSVMSCMLFEGTFYEEGATISARIQNLIPQVKPHRVAEIAIEARNKMHLRHVPLLIVREMARSTKEHRAHVASTLESVIQRADELAEFLAIYWGREKPCSDCPRRGDCETCKGTGIVTTMKPRKEEPISAQVKKGLARAFNKFDAHQLAKYNRDYAVKLRDVMFLTHPKPSSPVPAMTFEKLANNELPTPDTWEVAISACKDETHKRIEWTRLLVERKLGPMALIRNLRNFEKCGVDPNIVKASLLLCEPERVLPYRFIAAARHAPNFADELEKLMFKNLAQVEPLTGQTVLLVDVSESMDHPISAKSEMLRADAAGGLAILARQICENVRVLTFSDETVPVPNYRGFALAKAVSDSQSHRSTMLGTAVDTINRTMRYDRLIVITDEQSSDKVPAPKGRAYCINVASAKPGVGYGEWNHIDGWSAAVIDYIREYEKFEE